MWHSRKASMSPEPLTVTFADSSYLPLLEIWLPRLRQLGVDRIKVFCLDSAAFAWCESQQIAPVQIPWAGDLSDLWVQRIPVFNELLSAGEQFIHSDLDAIWLKNPLHSGSACRLDDDLIFSQGTVWPADVHALWGFVLCCGWFWAKPTPATRAFFRALQAHVQVTGDDQISVNRLLVNAGARWTHDEAGRYELPFNGRRVRCWPQPSRATVAAGQMSVSLLPQREFQRLPEDSADAVVKHFWTPQNCEQKLDALKKYGLL
jgi:Nucleotide-diphospho-sugar transferase